MPILAAKGTASVILFNQENRHDFCLNPLHFDDLNIGTHVRLVATILMKLSTVSPWILIGITFTRYSLGIEHIFDEGSKQKYYKLL